MTFQILNTKTEQELLAEALDARKPTALQEVLSKLSNAEEIVAGYTQRTQGEIDSWTEKVNAARAFKSNTATPEQIEILQTEANVTGESITDLVELKIIPNSRKFVFTAATTTGLRRVYKDNINNATSFEEIDTHLSDLDTDIENMLIQVQGM